MRIYWTEYNISFNVLDWRGREVVKVDLGRLVIKILTSETRVLVFRL